MMYWSVWNRCIDLDFISAQMQSVEHSLLLGGAYVLAIYAGVVAFVALIVRLPAVSLRLVAPGERYGGVDGLRGLLAMGVFVHHTVASYGYFMTGRWGWSDSALFNHLGQTSVAVFFMVTAFLFSSRLLAGSIDWRAIYLSRIARLVPLYVVFVAGVLASALHAGGWILRESLGTIAGEVGHWLAFSIIERPDINALPMTWTLSAGVNWSLRFEWFFYAFLPVLAFLLIPWRGARAAIAVATGFAVTLVAAALLLKHVGGWKLYVLHFAAGTVVALLYRHPVIRLHLASRWIRAVGLACLAGLLAFRDAEGGLQILLATAFFGSVVGTSGGLLRWSSIRWLGEISYGVYLLHGLVLYWALSSLPVASLTVGPYCALVVCLGISVVVIASTLHFAVELPGIRWGKRLGLRSRGHRPTAATA